MGVLLTVLLMRFLSPRRGSKLRRGFAPDTSAFGLSAAAWMIQGCCG